MDIIHTIQDKLLIFSNNYRTMQSKSTISALLLSNSENNLYLCQNGIDIPIFTSEMKRTQPADAKKHLHSEIQIHESIENETEDDENQREDNDVSKHITCISEIVEEYVREYDIFFAVF
jgi:hypothetical protein